MSLLLMVWDDRGDMVSDQFLGEVLLDLASGDMRGNVVWYDLQEHDLNCGSAPVSSPKFARSTPGCAAAATGSTGVLRSRSVSRQSSRDSAGRNAAANSMELTNASKCQTPAKRRTNEPTDKWTDAWNRIWCILALKCDIWWL